jgi:hypothetical protein
MSASPGRVSGIGALLASGWLTACGAPPSDEPQDLQDLKDVSIRTSALTAQDRLTACAQDPRVLAKLVSAEICAGADIFFRETFNGNGRNCGTCHPAGHNTTIDVPFITSLHDSTPGDPLFVFERSAALAKLENPADLFNSAGVLENVDGFENPTHKFVARSVPHVLSLSTSIARDSGDGTTNPPVDRTGWGGDGAPGDGSLRAFLTGAVTQHYTKTLARRPGIDFRLPTAQELDLTSAFQLSLGRLNELDLTQVNLFDAQAREGQRAFMDPQRGRCNVCHFNAGANFQDTRKNRNFDTGTRNVVIFSPPDFAGGPLFDGGFGGLHLARPNFDTLNREILDSFGNGTFSTPSLVEAADTGPFFHNNGFGPEIESAVSFYIVLFNQSPAGAELQARFGTPLSLAFEDTFTIGRFLRALNIAFNIDLATQRLSAALTLANRFPNTRVDIQLSLLRLAEGEIDDALAVLTGNTQQPFYPVAVDRLGLAKSEIAAARTASASARAGRISNAVSRTQNARDQIGANVTFKLGQGNLMF